MEERTRQIEERAKSNQVFTDEELDNVIDSLLQITPTTINNEGGDLSLGRNNVTDEAWIASLRKVLKDIAHVSHKDWTLTSTNAQKLLPFLIRENTNTNTTSQEGSEGAGYRRQDSFPGPVSASRYHRILTEGHWHEAQQHGNTSMQTTGGPADEKDDDNSPWAVLVTGVNGIRKTTSLYQPWFPTLLEEALVYPSSWDEGRKGLCSVAQLPTGRNSFFRQLDHMIATLCNKEFAVLYALTAKRLATSDGSSKDGAAADDDDGNDATDTVRTTTTNRHHEPLPQDIQSYSNLKAAIFTRYRTLSELLGVLLLQQAQQIPINCLLETSGRDVAMFHYVDHVFPSLYRKLALHFVINDLHQAQESVDRRMVTEIRAGLQAIQPLTTTAKTTPTAAESDILHVDTTASIIDIARVIDANAGGPYGSDVLPDVQEASDTVWDTVVDGTAGVGADWFKATILIHAHTSEPWTTQALRPDGTKGTMFQFE